MGLQSTVSDQTTGGAVPTEAFCETLRGRWGSVEVVDQLATLDDLVARGWADPDRLLTTGFL